MLEINKPQKLSAFTLKLIAAAAMLTDHMAVVFFDENFIMRSIGRLAFPIFAYLLAEGYKHTKDVKRYAIRLLAFALISQVPYVLAFGDIAYYPNVIFTLFLGLVSIYAYDRLEGALKLAVPFAVALLAEFAGSDHGAFGVIMVILFHTAQTKEKKLSSVAILIIITFAVYMFAYNSVQSQNIIIIFYLAPLALLYLYNGQRGAGGQFAKWFFYVFYPLHLLIIWIVKSLI